MNRATDFLGNELFLGDEVIFIELGYRHLIKGFIIKITPKTLLLSHGDKTTKQFHNQVVKIQNKC